MNPDFIDMLRALLNAEVRFIIVGAYALNAHTKPRATGDLDIWVQPTPDNARKLMAALADFGAPLDTVEESDFAKPGVIFQIGIVPSRIDVLTQLSGIAFDEAWRDRVQYAFGPIEVPFLGKRSLIQNKRATGRPRDLLDVESLEES
jgi:hypothetical protein